MMTVWILILYMGHSPTVIDNIASRAECERVKAIVAEGRYRSAISQCIEVWKVKP
jgi:hypothetical protein